MLKTKSGVQSLDVNDCLKLIFETAKISSLFEDDELINQWTSDYFSTDVEASVNSLKQVEQEDDLEPLEEQEDDEEAEETLQKPQAPDPMEEDPDKEEEKEEVDDESERGEVSKEDFKEAMQDLEDLLSDISPEQAESPDDENNH